METAFFERADMLDTRVGQAEKGAPAEVAKTGFDALMKGEGDVVSAFSSTALHSMSCLLSAW
jgi:hypothetical protein